MQMVNNRNNQESSDIVFSVILRYVYKQWGIWWGNPKILCRCNWWKMSHRGTTL